MRCNGAAANIEPSSYDAKSIGAGTTGMAYLDNPSALAINPANLARIERGGMSINITPVISVSRAPLAGPNSDVKSDLGFGPIPSLFGAVRVADRVVLGFGAYALGIFGAKYSNVQDLYGQPGAEGDFEVTFVSGEAAVGVAFEIIASLDLGVTLRVPFAWQRATVPAELGVVLIPTTATLGGAGWPGGRIGLTWRATSMIAASLMYRTVATSRLSGELQTLEILELSSSVTARFSTPHVLSGGVAFSLLNESLTVAGELHVMFYAASNQGQTLYLDGSEPLLPDTAEIPFLWQNAFSLRFGVDYQINRRFAIRGGYVPSSSATTDAGAQPVTPPPAWSHSFSAGFGASWKSFAVDFALQTAFSNAHVGPSTDPAACSGFIRVGCEGDYKTINGSASVQFVYKR
ncbi:MAG: outer membrane protein transport protein [Deltaproteobacteria bacterium]|nr:outer membrane protein transport protein [Deltaproteobacteria bacterium]